MKLSTFGTKFTADSATVSLMDDLGEALLVNPNLLFMGGGNPAAIPAVQAVFQQAMQHIVGDAAQLNQLLGVYSPPQGDPEFINALAAFLNRQCGWKISAKNIALTNGSQSAFSILFNLFAGDYADGTHKRVHLPLVPEYVGYADVGFTADFFTATKPHFDQLDKQTFKYRVDFDAIQLSVHTGMLCVSRPTNPTGNVITDAEVELLAALAAKRDVPLVIDGAYGAPFPNIIFTSATPIWRDNIIVVLSLSKLGLPGVRTGIVIANEDVVAAVNKTNTIFCLANGNLGQTLGKQLLLNDQLLALSNNLVQPFYRTAAEQASAWVKELFADLPCQMHSPEGAIFLWLWFEGLPIRSRDLYQRLKARGVLVLAGEDFFIGLSKETGEDWQHQYECIRVTYCQPPAVVRKGLEIIAEEVRGLYAHA